MFHQAWTVLDPPRHYLHVFTPPSLCQLVESAGFRTSSVSTTVREPDAAFVMSRANTRGNIPRVASTLFHEDLSLGVQVAEGTALKVRPDTGEEIDLLAAK